MDTKNKKFNSKVIHSGHGADKETGAVMPLFIYHLHSDKNLQVILDMNMQELEILQEIFWKNF